MKPLIDIFASSLPPICNHAFLGLVPWYHYLSPDTTAGSDKCSVHFNLLPNSGPSSLPLVLLAVIDDLLRIAGMVAVFFVITGAVKFITSDGNPEKVAAARQTIINSLIGLAIALTAIVFVSFLGGRLAT